MTSYNLSGSFGFCHVVRSTRYFLVLVLTSVGAFALCSFHLSGAVHAKTPGKTYCFRGTCHRVKTLSETKALVGRDIKISASFYDACSKDRFNNCGLTSSGEVYKPHKADNAASSILPDGTVALVWSETSGQALVLRINNAGPYWGDRKLDLSAAAARKLGVTGVEDVTLRIVKVPTEFESRYEKNRSYDPVIGPLGKFASLELALKAMTKIRSDGLKNTPSLANLEKPLSPSAADFDPTSLGEPVFISPVTYEDEVRGRGLTLTRDNGGIKLLKPITELPPLLNHVTVSPRASETLDISSEPVESANSLKHSLKFASVSKVIQTAELTDNEASKYFTELMTNSLSGRESNTVEQAYSLLAAFSSFTLNKFSLFTQNTEQIPLLDLSTSSSQIASLENIGEGVGKTSRTKSLTKKANNKISSPLVSSPSKKFRSDLKIAALTSSAAGDLKAATAPATPKKTSSQSKGETVSVKSKKKET